MYAEATPFRIFLASFRWSMKQGITGCGRGTKGKIRQIKEFDGFCD
jgi:hypothetical protein